MIDTLKAIRFILARIIEDRWRLIFIDDLRILLVILVIAQRADQGQGVGGLIRIPHDHNN